MNIKMVGKLVRVKKEKRERRKEVNCFRRNVNYKMTTKRNNNNKHVSLNGPSQLLLGLRGELGRGGERENERGDEKTPH